MSLLNLVPSLETCKQLQAAGFPQNTALKWVCSDDGCYVIFTKSDEPVLADLCAAPTAEEILKELPPTILRGEKSYYLEVQITPGWGWDVDWTDDNGTYLEPRGETTCWQSVAHAAALAYLWLRKVKP